MPQQTKKAKRKYVRKSSKPKRKTIKTKRISHNAKKISTHHETKPSMERMMQKFLKSKLKTK